MQLPINGKPENLPPYCMTSAEPLQYQWRNLAACASWHRQDCIRKSHSKSSRRNPDSLTRIHSDRTYNDKLINHPPFQRDQMWYLGRKVSGSSCLCSGCFHPWCIQNNDLHLCVKDLLLLNEQRAVDAKLRFCLSTGSVNVISSSYNNIRPLGNKSVLLDPQLEIITAEGKGKSYSRKI